MRSASRLAWLLLLGACSLPREPEKLERFEYTEAHMGTTVGIVLYAPDRETADRAAAAAYAEFGALDARMSDYRPESELSRLSAASGTGSREISAPLAEVLSASVRFARETGGAFDVTLGPVVRLWRQARRDRRLPEAGALRAARALTGPDLLSVDGRTATLRRKGMRLDLGGIAKGYACDRALEVLRREGTPRAFVDAGGGMALGDPPPDRPFWRIRILNRRDLVLKLARCGIATSGDTEQFVEIGGVRYSHIVDPATGSGLTSRAMATVVAPDGLTADALATSLCVMGAERGLALAERRNGVEARMFWMEDGRRRTARTPGFQAMIK